MRPDDQDSASVPPAIEALIAEFLDSETRGTPIDRVELIRSNPEHAEALNDFFASHDRMKSAAHAAHGHTSSEEADHEQATIAPGNNALEDQTLAPQTDELDEATLPASDSQAAPAEPMVGERVRYFGDYELLEEIARGGMGVVFKARQTNLNRIVALKMILAGQFAGEEDVQRFYTEAEAAAQLDHPGIVPIFEIGEHAGQHYFSMGYIEGESLAARIAEGPLDPTRAATLLAQISQAMSYAHERGVIHRDLKPANILLDSNGQPKVTDFGLAKRTEADSGLTGTGQILGTPSYMPPEQASGAVEEVGHLADVYALGAVLYSTLTGRPPFQAASPMDTLLQVIEKEPLAPKQLNPEIDEDLQTICLKCLEKQPEKRYASAQELLDELNRYLAGEPIVARPIGKLERAGRWCKRKPALAGLIAVAASLILVLSIGGPTIAIQQADFARRQVELKSDAEDARDEAEDRRVEAEQSRNAAVSARKDVERQQEQIAGMLYATRISLAHREVLNGNSNRAQQLLLECPQGMRNWEWHYLDGLTRSEDLTLFAHNVANSVQFLPSGKTLMTAGLKDSRIKSWSVDTGLEISSETITNLRSVSAPIDDEHVLVVQGPGAIYVGTADRKLEVFGNFGVEAMASSLFAGGKRVAVAFKDGTIVLYERPAGKEKREVGKELFRSPVKISSESPHLFSPSARLVASTEDLVIKVSRVATGEALFEVKGHGMQLEAMAFSPDETLLATVDRAGRIILTDVASGQRTQLIQAHAGGVKCVTFDSDGKRIATGSMDRTCKVFDVVSGSELLTIRGHAAAIIGVDFNPKGDMVATASMDGTVRLWSIADRLNASPEVMEHLTDQKISHFGHAPGLESTIFYSSPLPLYDAKFSPDGRFLTSTAFRLENTAGQEFVKVWSVDDASIHASFPVPGGYLHTIAYSSDSRYLIVASGGAGDGVMPSSVTVWDLETNEELGTIAGVTCMLTRAALNKENDILALSFGNLNYGTIRSYTFPDLELIQEKEVSGERLSAISFSASGDELLSSSTPGGKVEVWNARTGQDLGDFVAHGSGVFQIAVSSKDLLATANIDSSIGIWDWRKGEKIGELKGHSAYAVDIDFSPDGSRLVSASEDETVKVWDLETFAELLSFHDHLGPALGTDWSDDGDSIASASRDGALIVRRIERDEKLEPLDQWVTIRQDDFDRDEPGPSWIGAAIKIEDGRLVGSLTDTPAGGSSFAACFAILSGIDLPRTVDISVDVSIRQPMLAQLVLSNLQTQRYIAPFIASTTKPYGFIGSQVQVARGEGLENKMLGSRSDARLEPGTTYRMRLIRQVDQLQFFLDDRLLSHVRVPTMEAEIVQLSGCFGKIGDQIEFDNLVIRIPPSEIRKQEIREKVRGWLTKMILPDLVSEKIAEHFQDDSERELASQILSSMNSGKEGLREELLAALTAVSVRPDATEEEYAIASRQAEHLLPQASDPTALGKISLAFIRSGQIELGLQTLERAIKGGIDRNGYPDALMIAARAIASVESGELEKARRDHQRVRDLNLTWWPDEVNIAGLLEELQSKAPLPDLPVRKQLVDLIVKKDRAFWQEGDTNKMYEHVAPEYVLTFGRNEDPGPQDRSLKRADAKKLEAIFSANNPPPFLKLAWDPIRFQRNGDQVTIKIVGISKESENVFRFAHTYEFEKRDSWKIVNQRTWQLDQRIDGTWMRYDNAFFDELDQEIEKGIDDKIELARKLFRAWRLDEAADTLDQVNPSDGARKAEKLALQGEIEVTRGNFSKAMELLEEARRIDPSVWMPWFFSRSIATFTDWQSNPFGIAFHPTQPLMVAAYRNSRVILWDLEKRKKVRTIDRAHGSFATDVVFSEDGSRFFSVGFDAVLNVYDTETCERLSQYGGHLSRIYRIERHPEKDIVVTASQDGTAKVWDLESGHELFSLAGHAGGVMGATFSPDATQIATASSDGTVRLWDAQSGKEIAKFFAHAGGAWRVDYTPDGKRLVSCGRDRQVRVWNAEDQTEIATLKGHNAGLEVVRVSPDGSMAASADVDGDIWIWDLENLKPVVRLYDASPNYAIYFRGKTLFTAGDDVNQWDIDFSRSPLSAALERSNTASNAE